MLLITPNCYARLSSYKGRVIIPLPEPNNVSYLSSPEGVRYDSPGSMPG